MDWSGLSYLGLEVGSGLIASNREKFGSPNIHFEHAPARLEDVPPADLLVIYQALGFQNSTETLTFRI
jgi:hypothetical protein